MVPDIDVRVSNLENDKVVKDKALADIADKYDTITGQLNEIRGKSL